MYRNVTARKTRFLLATIGGSWCFPWKQAVGKVETSTAQQYRSIRALSSAKHFLRTSYEASTNSSRPSLKQESSWSWYVMIHHSDFTFQQRYLRISKASFLPPSPQLFICLPSNVGENVPQRHATRRTRGGANTSASGPTETFKNRWTSGTRSSISHQLVMWRMRPEWNALFLHQTHFIWCVKPVGGLKPQGKEWKKLQICHYDKPMAALARAHSSTRLSKEGSLDFFPSLMVCRSSRWGSCSSTVASGNPASSAMTVSPKCLASLSVASSRSSSARPLALTSVSFSCLSSNSCSSCSSSASISGSGQPPSTGPSWPSWPSGNCQSADLKDSDEDDWLLGFSKLCREPLDPSGRRFLLGSWLRSFSFSPNGARCPSGSADWLREPGPLEGRRQTGAHSDHSPRSCCRAADTTEAAEAMRHGIGG